MRSVWSAAGTWGALSGITDTGCQNPLASCIRPEWNRLMSTSLDVVAVTVGARPLTPDEVTAVARADAHVEVAADALTRVAATRELIERLAGTQPGRIE